MDPGSPAARLSPWPLLLVLACSHVSAGAQPRVEWGDAEPLETKGENVQVIRLADGRHCTIEYAPRNVSGKHVTLRLFDAGGKKIRQEKVKFESQSGAFIAMRPELERYVELGGRRYFLLREFVPKTRTLNLHAWGFDAENLTVAAEPVTVAAVPYRDYQFTAYRWTVDRAGERLHVLESPGKVGAPANELTLKTYDAGMKLLSTRRFPLPPEIDLLQVNAFGLERGNLVISCTLFETRPKVWGKKLPGYKLVYFILPEGAETLRTVTVALPGAVPHHAKHAFDGPDRFLCFGLYSKSKDALSSGAFFVRYGLNGEQLGDPQLRDFPASITDHVDRRRKASKDSDPDAVPAFKIYDVRFRGDGGLQFIAEQSSDYWSSFQYQTVSGGTEVTTTVSGTVYEYDDILVYTLYEDPARDWFTLIRKRQSAMGTDRDFSFSHAYAEDGTAWLLYNDLPENLDLPLTEEPANLRAGKGKTATVLGRVDPQGRVTRQVLFTRKDLGHGFVPRSTVPAPDGAILLTAVSDDSYRIGRLALRD